MLDYFGVSLAEITERLPTVMPSPEQIEQQICKAAGSGDQLARLQEQLTQLARKNRREWLKNSLVVCQVLALKLARKNTEARELSDRLAACLLKGDFMTNFDFWLLSQVADQVSYAKLNALLASGQVKQHLINPGERSVAVDFYCQTLDSALTAGDAAAALTVCEMIDRQGGTLETYRLGAYQQFSKLVEAVLRNQEFNVDEKLTTLTAALSVICPTDDAARMTARFERDLSLADHIVGARPAYQLVSLPVHRETDIAVTLNRLRDVQIN